MQNLGFTRSTRQADHALFTPESFVRAPWPGMKNAAAIVHVSPAMGAAFTEYTVEFEAGGVLGPAVEQRFLFVLDGEITVALSEKKTELSKDMYAYIPSEADAVISAKRQSRALVIEKPYQPQAGAAAPGFFSGNERTLSSQPLQGDESLQVRSMIPDNPSFDFAVNTMSYQPGAALLAVEIHVMEHGLLMLSGGGIYRLSDKWYPVAAGDFIWMAPYCPQWFGAIGKIPAKYIIYKDWNRHPLESL